MDKNLLVERLRKNLRTLRKQEELSLEALSKKAGFDESYAGKLERGEKCPSLHTVDKLAEALEVDPVRLFQ